MEKMTVDIIIPTYRPDTKFKELIRRLEQQTYRARMVYIMNTETGDFPKAAIAPYENIRVMSVKPEEFDHGGTRDKGASMSDADILLFMTQDAVPGNHKLIEKLVDAFAEERISAAYARQLPTKDCALIERYTRSFNYPAGSSIKSQADIETLGIKTYFCSNVCAAYRRSVYESLGGFVKKTIFNEDMIMAGQMVQAGYEVAYVAEAEVIHSHNYNCVQQFHRNFDVAVSQVDNPDVFGKIKSESEGIRLVKKTAVFLFKSHNLWFIPSLLIKSGFKYIGYKLGRNYKYLPQCIVQRCTMNPRYWAG